MPLQKQKIPLPLARGVNSKVDDKQLAPGELITLENAVFETVKKIKKRNGYTAPAKTILDKGDDFTFPAYTEGGSVGSASFIEKFESEIVLGDGKNLFSYNEADDEWAYKGKLESTQVNTKPIYQDNLTRVHCDSAINTTTGLSLYAWEKYSSPPFSPSETYVGVEYLILDTETDNLLFRAVLSATTLRPKPVAIGNNLYLLYFDSSDGYIHALAVTPEGAGTDTDLLTNPNTTTPNYDAFVLDNTTLYIGYNGASTTVKIASFDSALSSQGTHSESSESAPNGIGIFADDSDNIWCAYNDGTDTKAFIRDAALSSEVLAVTTVESSISDNQNVTGVFDGTQGIIYYDQPGDPEKGQDTTIDTATSSFTQPAVGSAVLVTFSADVTGYFGQTVFIENGGYYLVSSLIVGTPTQAGLTNLGSPSNVAPSTSVGTGNSLFEALKKTNSIIRRNTLTAAGSAGTAAVFLRSAALCSRAFVDSDNISHVLVGHDSTTQPTYFLASLYNVGTAATETIGHISSKVFAAEAGGIPFRGLLTSPNNFTGSTFRFALPRIVFNVFKTSSNVAVARSFNGGFAADINLAPTSLSRLSLGKNLHIASGVVQMFDGSLCVEHNFHLFPHYLTVTESGSNGFLSAGTYSWIAVYQWIDDQGNVHRSAPSPAQTLTVSADSRGDVVIPTLRLTAKPDVTIALYRTVADGTTYFRVDTNLTSYPFSNDLTTNTITIQDISGDDDITGNEQLYTDGELANSAFPAPLFIGKYKNRAIVVPADNDTSDIYSKQVVPGFPVEPSLSFTRNTEQTSGAIIGEFELDDKNILFKENKIFYIVGSGPAPSGVGNDFTDPIEIPSDVGTIDRNSITLYPNGVLFKSNKGIYLLDRSLQVQYVGAKVESFNSQTVVKSLVHTTLNHVIFFLSGGSALVYDYFVNEWTVFTNHSAVDAIIYEKLLYFVNSSGQVYKEADGTFADNGSFITMLGETGWLNFAEVSGFARLYKALIAGAFKSNHSLTLEFYYDYETTASQSITITPTNSTPYKFEFRPSRQKASAFKVKWYDVETDTQGESYELSNIAFEVGAKRGMDKLQDGQVGG